MFILKALLTLFLLPGTLALNAVNITIDEDSGMFRSLINMVFWGFIGAGIILAVMHKG
jgi:hypothetical protein